MFLFVYCHVSVLKDLCSSCCFTCSFVVLLMSKLCCWRAKTRTKSDFFEMYTCLGSGVEMLFRHKGLKWDAASIYFFVLVNLVAFFVGTNFFLEEVRCWVEFFSYCSVTEALAYGFHNWFDQEWVEFRVCSVGIGLSRRFHICMDLSLQKLLKYHSLLTTSNLFDSLFEGCSGLFPKCASTFQL